MSFVVSAMDFVMYVFGYTYLIYFGLLAFYKAINIIILIFFYYYLYSIHNYKLN